MVRPSQYPWALILRRLPKISPKKNSLVRYVLNHSKSSSNLNITSE